MPAPTRILELTGRFDYNLESYKSGKYNETQVRLEYINPLMEELGWDVTNKQGYSEAYKDVVPVHRQKTTLSLRFNTSP